MVDTVSSSSGTATAMTTAMAKLQDDINKLRQQFQSGTPAKSSDEVESFRKDVRKSPFNTVASATDIGVLVKDTSWLNAISALTKSDPVDFYKFRTANDGQVALGALGDDTVRIQFLSQGGAVIADNDDQESDRITRENYDKLKEDSFDLEKGIYVVRVSRKSGSDSQAVQNYAVQLTMGDSAKDYDTVAKAALATDRYGPTTPQSTQNLFDMLNSSVSTLQSLGPIGQSGTDKLLGTLTAAASEPRPAGAHAQGNGVKDFNLIYRLLILVWPENGPRPESDDGRDHNFTCLSRIRLCRQHFSLSGTKTRKEKSRWLGQGGTGQAGRSSGFHPTKIESSLSYYGIFLGSLRA